MLQRRKYRRKLTFRTGKIILPIAASSIDCAVLDFSQNGACILVPDAREIPVSFRLVLDLCPETVFDCSVKWKNRNRIGVAFQADGRLDVSGLDLLACDS